MRLHWTTPAAHDLYRIAEHIQRDNPAAADRVTNTLYLGCATLEEFPRRGREGRIKGTRELVLAGLPYIVVYRIKNEAIEVLRIYHGAQNWP